MQEFLDTHNLEVENRTDARKEAMDAAAVWDLMGSAKQIIVAKGRRIENFVPTEDTRESILKVVIGRSGSLRAPTVQSGDVFLVGFNETLYGPEAPFT
ncbi:MAG: ArsC family (seleno)protein [Candidatus Poribacteria bacterium]|nr:ArsC family (seleno)protein [Candidatus Poribacteria bacterium]